jgi:FkbM family methyltransferase
MTIKFNKDLYEMKRSKTNSGILGYVEKLVRSHPLPYFFIRYLIRYTNIFEEDAKGVSFLNLGKNVNIMDIGASDGIAAKFFCNNLNVKNIICYEPNISYVKILRKLNIKGLIVKPYAIGNTNTYKKIFFPRSKFFNKNLDLIPYTYYDKETLSAQLKLDFKFRKNIQIIEKKLHIKKVEKLKLKIDLIKIDVNDNGLSVINGLSKIIKKDKPALLIETDSDILKIDRQLKSYGYGKYIFSNLGNKFIKIKKKFPLNTYFLQKKHLEKNK